ncbi:putative short chain dehydrogenase/reductase [Actinomycetospora sp. NBRC 106375]|uniref:SDR family oxidoreductase n=1 Tax=Actinomycetospora sp. NBRC 106375 TaxID=3032207 RepID=UPI0024A3493F|nr:SDR family oxidoreductase [Actinomycetospora sp. NBRC 106375]GLZ49574.1 putative short chain dehydrogenase/reductase [Actinomycetospora sp. NBRC 106375]
MELRDRVAVVTGAGGGIGRALVGALADAGARVVATDLDVPEVDGAAVARALDVTDAEATAALLDEVGPVDVYLANAGVAAGTDPMDTPDELWETVLGVNVRAHITAAKLLLPGWLERGEGYFVATASAAGLLTQIGSAPYAVSKHAAVAFAEWLSVTYGARGVRVSTLCPMGVATPMLDTGADEGGMSAAATGAVRAAGEVLTPEAVAAAVVEGIGREEFLILPHPEVLTFFRRKADDYERWLAGMRRLQESVSR